MATTCNLISPPRGFPRLLLALVLFGGTAEAQVPVVFKVSEGVRPNAVVPLYGEYLTGTPTVRFLRSDGTVAATQTSRCRPIVTLAVIRPSCDAPSARPGMFLPTTRA
jgi:hypothetical protein